MKLQPESKKELTRIACGTAICTAVMWVIFAALHLVGWVKFDYTVVLGSLIGAAVAIAFAKEGADVAIAYYSSDDDAQAVAERIRELGRRALVFKGDIGDEAFCRDMVEGIAAEWGRLDVLVNNAGEQTPAESILDLTQSSWSARFQTNIFSMFYLVKAALPHCPREAPS